MSNFSRTATETEYETFFFLVRQNQTHHIPDQRIASQSMLSTEVGEGGVSPESDILRKFSLVSFHAASDEGTPQNISPQDTPTDGLTCQCNQTSLHHNLYRFAFLPEPCYVSVGNSKLLLGAREGFFVPAMGPERGLQPRLCDRVIFAEEGSELDDVGNEVFAEDDIA